MRTARFLVVGIFLCAVASAQLQTTDLGTLTPDQVAGLLAGPGIQITNMKLTGDPTAAGSFTGGANAGVGFESGIIMSTGVIADAAGPNDTGNKTGTLDTPGDASLDSIVAPNKTKDATILEFDFITDSENFAIRYVFASEEYQEFVGSPFNDVFAFFLNATNIALIPNTTQPVAINTVNHEINTLFYRDNPANSDTMNIQFDGLTTVLIATSTVVPGQSYHIKLAIADTTDDILDSAVFLAQGGITGTAPTTLTLDPREVFTGNSQSFEATVTGFELPRSGSLILTASGLPEDSTVTFGRSAIDRENFQTTVRVNIGPSTLPNSYVLVVTGTNEEQGVTAAATMLIHVDCVPPFIFGLSDHQPAGRSIGANETTDLKVIAQGTPPLKYQWYLGAPGSTAFPVEGATSATLRTGPIVTATNYWVRVSNPCGSFDSAAAVVAPR